MSVPTIWKETTNKRVQQATLAIASEKHASTGNRNKASNKRNAAATIRSGTEPFGSVREPPTETINLGTSLESGTVNKNVELSRINWIGLDCGTKCVAGTTNWSNQSRNQTGIWNGEKNVERRSRLPEFRRRERDCLWCDGTRSRKRVLVLLHGGSVRTRLGAADLERYRAWLQEETGPEQYSVGVDHPPT